MENIYGFVEFPILLICSSDVLGKSFDITLGEQKGFLEFPLLPEGGVNDPLLPPMKAKIWERSNKEIYWGRLIRSPGIYEVVKALIVFENNKEMPTTEIGNKILEAFPGWIDLFCDYIGLISKHIPILEIVSSKTKGLNLFAIKDGKQVLAHDTRQGETLIISSQVISLKDEQIKRICNLCSANKKLSIPHSFLLEAYRARQQEDFRKAILLSAIAVELALTEKIKEKCDSSGITFVKKLLEDYKALSGRIELARMIDIGLPDKDYKSFLVEPRNNVVHRGDSPDISKTWRAIQTTEELLAFFYPEEDI